MMRSIFIDGAAGTTGLEIRERLAGRSEFHIVTLEGEARRDRSARAQALNDADFVILCLPDDAAREAVSLIENERVRVIDASSAHRTEPDWTYGFAELEPAQTQAIAEARLVSNPGCYPTAFLALVRPLIRTGLVPYDWPLSVNAVSGYSGGGKALIAAFEDAAAPDATATAHRAYAVGLAHKHVPEMQRHARIEHPPIFQPSVARTFRGMLAEVPLPLHALPRRPSLAAIENALRDAYRDCPLIHIVADEEAGAIEIERDAGSDRMTLHVCGNADRGQARLIATLDNLGKGASGAAVQNLNIMAGLDPVAGLQL